MSEDFTRWDDGKMSEAEADLRLAYRQIKENLENLEKDLEKTLGQWESEAREYYDDARRQWNEGAAGLNDILAQLGVAVGNIRENYTATEKNNASIFGG